MSLSKEQMKKLVNQWKDASLPLKQVRDDELRNSEYDWHIVDALLELGMQFSHTKESSGLVEMQKFFKKIHFKLKEQSSQL